MAGGPYRPEGFAREGFVHLSTEAQVLATAGRYYRDAAGRGVPGLVLLEVDPARADARLVFEDLLGRGEAFPHLYGPIPLDAVVAVHAFEPDAEGAFKLPW